MEAVKGCFQMFNTTSGRGDHREIDPPCSYEDYSQYFEEPKTVETQSSVDKIQDPDHYKQGVSPYDVAKTMYGAEGLLTFVTVNSIKYIQRYPHKYKGSPVKQLDDLIKAKRSLETAIELHKEIHGDSHIRHG